MKKKILIIASDLPIPVVNGTTLRLFNLFNKLKDEFVLYYAVRFDSAEKLDSISLNSDLFSKVIYIISNRPSMKRKLIIVIKSIIKGIPLLCQIVYFPELIKKIETFLKNNEVDAIHYDHIEYGRYIHKLRKYNCKHILVVDDIPSDRHYEEYKNNKNIVKKIISFYSYCLYRKYEKNIINEFDNIITVSEYNKNKIRENIDSKISKNIILIENGADISKKCIKKLDNSTFNLMFLGSLKFEPNRDGVIWFLDKVIPLLNIRKLNYKLYIIGSYPSSNIEKYKSDKIIVTGYVEDLLKYYELCDMLVAPIFSGGGTRTKILEAMGYKTLVLSTTKGCQGIDVIDGESIIIADDEVEFCNAIVNIYNNAELKKKIELKGYDVAKESYDWNMIGNKLINYYQELLV